MLDLFLMKPPEAEGEDHGPEPHRQQTQASGQASQAHPPSYGSPNPQQHFSRHNTPSSSSTYSPSQPASSPGSTTSPISPISHRGYTASSPQELRQQTTESYAQLGQTAYAYSTYPNQAIYTTQATVPYSQQAHTGYASYPNTTAASTQPGYPQYTSHQYTAMYQGIAYPTPPHISGSYPHPSYPASSATPAYSYASTSRSPQYLPYGNDSGTSPHPPQQR